MRKSQEVIRIFFSKNDKGLSKQAASQFHAKIIEAMIMRFRGNKVDARLVSKKNLGDVVKEIKELGKKEKKFGVLPYRNSAGIVDSTILDSILKSKITVVGAEKVDEHHFFVAAKRPLTLMAHPHSVRNTLVSVITQKDIAEKIESLHKNSNEINLIGFKHHGKDETNFFLNIKASVPSLRTYFKIIKSVSDHDDDPVVIKVVGSYEAE
jgi:prephenate dehydratase